jgi:hypothetical protein
MLMAAKPRTKTTKHVAQPGHCPVCGHLIAEVVTSTGQVLHLDTTSPQTWVFSGRETPEGTPLAVQSRSYIEHREPCQGG